MVTIYRWIQGVSLNGKEWLLDEDDKLQTFSTVKDALKYVGFSTEKEAEQNGIYLQMEAKSD